MSKQECRSFWDSNPCVEGEEFDARNARFSKELKELDFPSKREQTVIDIGCGTGFETVSYAIHGAYGLGLDMSIESLRRAQERAREQNVSPDFILGDAESLPLRDDTLDFVSSLGALHHTPNTAKAIEELRRVLKSGKKAVVMLYYKHSLLITILRLRNIRPETRYDWGCPIVKFSDRAEARAMFRGFKRVSMRTYGIPDYGLRRFRLILPIIRAVLERYLGWALYIRAIK